ncbi:MAG: hypothetical protein Q8R24_07345 [Legionellaceae bacterium]|nr:hypothetical protein [Legionellaceae bacterium]
MSAVLKRVGVKCILARVLMQAHIAQQMVTTVIYMVTTIIRATNGAQRIHIPAPLLVVK